MWRWDRYRNKGCGERNEEEGETWKGATQRELLDSLKRRILHFLLFIDTPVRDVHLKQTFAWSHDDRRSTDIVRGFSSASFAGEVVRGVTMCVCLRNVRGKGKGGGCMISLTARFIWLTDHFVDFIR